MVIPIDEATAKPGRPVEAGDGPSALAIGDGSLWIAQTGAGTLARLDLARREIVGTPVSLSSGDGDGIEVGEGAVWSVDSSEKPRVARIDPDSRKVTRRVPIPDGVNGDLAVGEGAVWVVNQERSSITAIDASSGKISGEPIDVGRPADGFGGEVAVGGGAVWASSPEDDVVSRIDPRSREVVKRIKVATGIGSDIAFGFGYLWVVNDGGSLIRIDPSSNSVRGRPIPGSPVGIDDLEVGGDALWAISGSDENTVVRIGP
jgi:streptogramin lyase